MKDTRNIFKALLGVGLSLLLIFMFIIPAQAAGTFSPAGSMTTPRLFHRSAMLSDGKILIVDGRSTPSGNSTGMASAELYDPATGTFSATGGMSTARQNSVVQAVLSSSKVLVAGGVDTASVVLASAELYDPATGTFTATGSMGAARMMAANTMLSDGRVLITGGNNGAAALASAELYDPATGTFSPTGTMTAARQQHGSTRLSDGKVLIAGGNNGAATLASAELYDPATGTFTATGSMGTARQSFGGIQSLPNGKFLIAGGESVTGGVSTPLASAELFDPAAGTFSATGSMGAARRSHGVTALLDGQVLVTGGRSTGGAVLASAETYDPITGTFSSAGSMSTPRMGHRLQRLSSGTVLIAGGQDNNNTVLATAELFSVGQIQYNQVSATFDTNYTYATLGDSVGNITTRQPIGLSSNLRNQSDATGQAVVGPILNLSTTQTVTSVYSTDYLVPGSTYRWQFPDIAQNQSFNGGGNIAQMVDFTTGFTASRSVNQRRFPTTGGTQILTLSTTPKEPMDRLELNGDTRVDGLDIATVTAVSGDGITIDPDTKRFRVRIDNPVVDHLYQWQVTIQIGAAPADFLALEYMPQTTVRNVDIIASGNLPGNSLARSTALVNWSWQATGSYSWNWEEKLNKQVNLQGYAVHSFVTAPTQETINQSIDNGLAWLRTQQHPDGSWYWGRPARPNQPVIPEAPNVGMTGLSVWSLLHGLVPQTDPAVSAGINFLLSKQVTDPTNKDYGAFRSDQSGQPTYETSLAILALRATNNPIYLPQMRLAADYIAKAQNDEGVVYPHIPGGITSSYWAYGGWGYRYASESNQITVGGVQQPVPWYVWSDLSNTQLAMIALKAAQEAGIQPSHDTWANIWAKAATFVTRCQYSDGGFGYQPQSFSSGNSYGLATGAGVWCLRLSGAPVQDPRIQAGLTWLDSRPLYDRDPQSNQYHYYYLWNAAKAFTLSDRPPVLTPGSWYYNFAGYLLAYQQANGQWVNPIWPEGESNLNATGYALLVLEKAVLPPPPGIDSIKIDHMRIEFDTRPNGDKIKILQASFQLNKDARYDLSRDAVTVTVDGIATTIPAGSFKRDGNSDKYHYSSAEKSADGAAPRVTMDLDFAKGAWSFMVHDVNARVVDNSNGVDVTLMIGYMLAGQNVPMWIDYLVYPPTPKG